MDLRAEHAGATSVITVSGEIDADTGYPLFLAVVGEAEMGASRVVLDLAAVSFVDSVGLGMLVRSRDELASHYESRLTLAGPGARLLSLLAMTALLDSFTIVSSFTLDDEPVSDSD